MEPFKRFSATAVFLSLLIFSVYLSGCSDDKMTEPTALSDDEYLTSTALNSAFSTNTDDDDNLFSSEVNDFDSEGPVPDFGGFDNPIDSLVKWGRRITGTNINTNITTIGDSIKNVLVTRTINGNFIIIGYVSGALDSIVKPYSQEQKRTITFKRIGNRPNPRLNWRVYKYSAIDGETKTPQIGKSNIVMTKIEFYRNDNLVLTLNGPDFTVNVFNARFFHGNGNGMFDFDGNDEMRVKVYATSNQPDTDIVSYHWARNSFGFHRERFTMTSQVPNGTNFDRTYEKTLRIYPQHGRGMHNAFISANTRSSLYDDSPSLFSSTYTGFPYRVRP